MVFDNWQALSASLLRCLYNNLFNFSSKQKGFHYAIVRGCWPAVKTLNEWMVTKAGLWSLVPEYSKTLDRRRSQSIIISIGYLYNEPTHRAFYILGIFMKSIIIEPWESFLRRVAECVSYHEGADFDRDALCFSCNLCISCSVFFFTFLKLSLFILQKIYMLTVECETKLFVNPLITVLLLK